MKRLLCLMLCLCLLAALAIPVLGASEIRLKAENANELQGVTKTGAGTNNWQAGNYIGFTNVNFDGIASVSLTGDSIITGIENGDAYQIRIDDPIKGDCLGYVLFNKAEAKGATFSVNIKPTSGVHNLYIKSTYGQFSQNVITDILLSPVAVEVPDSTPVPDSAVIDNFADTWTGTDALGRKLADYEEVGPIKPGRHDVLMFYWNWFVKEVPTANARIPSQIVAAYPEAKDDYNHSAWDTNGAYFWNEPLLGYYTSNDYWVYRRHAEMLANAGVDAVFLDMSNATWAFIPCTVKLFSAFADAKEAGVKAPRIFCWATSFDYALRAVYHNIFSNDRYRDMFYQLDGKYLVYGGQGFQYFLDRFDENSDAETVRVFKEMNNTFTQRINGARNTGDSFSGPTWQWLQNYPQTKWNTTSDGRVECMTIGTGINQSYVFNYEKTGVFSDPYSKGRAYTEAFGEDYREGAMNQGYFFREQASRVLAEDPSCLMVDGWNEWTAGRQSIYSGFTNAFVDTYDDENSRDFEPSAGVLRDDYYNLLVDFIRKYKGVRPAPTASAPVTIALDGDLAQWDSVAPEFINVVDGYERDGIGYVNYQTGENYHYTTKVNNVITGAKVARDGDFFYFLATTKAPVSDGVSFMHLYIDIDRNRATGWEGYDFSVNVSGEGQLAAYNNGTWQALAEAETLKNGNAYLVKLPRTLLGETATADFEFKWADAAEENGDILRFYQYGSVAPAGRFNYLYTEIAQESLPLLARQSLENTSVLKDGVNRMNVNGGEMYVYEPDTRISTFTQDGVLYIPAVAAEEILGYGETILEYDADKSMLFLSSHKLENAEITDYRWSYTTLDSLTVHINGSASALSHPAIEKDGVVYLPVTYFKEVFDWTVSSVNDYIVISRTSNISASVAQAAALL